MFIDVEGFGSLYGKERADSLWGLSDLMEGIIVLGRAAPQLRVRRFFAHQFGDGFVVTEDSASALGRMAAVAMALHQYVLVKSGHFCGSALERGGLADVVGCYPKAVTESDHHAVQLGEGLMTITPVIGTALIKTYKLLGQHHGSVVVLPAGYRNDLEAGTEYTETNGVLYLNWIESAGDTLTRCRQALRIASYDVVAMQTLARDAASRNGCPAKWLAATETYLGFKMTVVP